MAHRGGGGGGSGGRPLVCMIKKQMSLSLLLVAIILILGLVIVEGKNPNHTVTTSFSRNDFPPGFVFGAATSAYQIEGGASEGGKGPSIWDTFTKNTPDMITDRSNGSVAIDAYHRYKGDIGLMKDMGIDAYRFSISWSRLLSNGKLSGGINEEGVKYYNNVINELMSQGIEPYVTIFHWDLPQNLEDQYNGFLSPLIIEDFQNYADLCFKLFGDRVKHWITFNEPWTYCQRGYVMGIFPPARCSQWEAGHCSVGDSGREPYIAAHHLLIAHGSAVKLYREKYQAAQKGKIGITLITHWFLPYSNSKSDKDASTRAIDFMFGWFMDPLTQGDYPFNMRAIVGDRLPQFTTEQAKMVKGSIDFLGLNYYTSNYADSISLLRKVNVSYDDDVHAFQTDGKARRLGSISNSEYQNANNAANQNWILQPTRRPTTLISHHANDLVKLVAIYCQDDCGLLCPKKICAPSEIRNLYVLTTGNDDNKIVTNNVK